MKDSGSYRDTDNVIDKGPEEALLYCLYRKPAKPDGIDNGFQVAFYQGYAGEVGEPLVRKVWQMTMNGFEPDMTIILDVPPERGLDRIRKNRGAITINQLPITNPKSKIQNLKSKIPIPNTQRSPKLQAPEHLESDQDAFHG